MPKCFVALQYPSFVPSNGFPFEVGTLLGATCSRYSGKNSWTQIPSGGHGCTSTKSWSLDSWTISVLTLRLSAWIEFICVFSVHCCIMHKCELKKNENKTTSMCGVHWRSAQTMVLKEKNFLTCGFGFRCTCRCCQRVSQCHWKWSLLSKLSALQCFFLASIEL